jgi:hypothetical protein
MDWADKYVRYLREYQRKKNLISPHDSLHMQKNFSQKRFEFFALAEQESLLREYTERQAEIESKMLQEERDSADASDFGFDAEGATKWWGPSVFGDNLVMWLHEDNHVTQDDSVVSWERLTQPKTQKHPTSTVWNGIPAVSFDGLETDDLGDAFYSDPGESPLLSSVDENGNVVDGFTVFAAFRAQRATDPVSELSPADSYGRGSVWANRATGPILINAHGPWEGGRVYFDTGPHPNGRDRVSMPLIQAPQDERDVVVGWTYDATQSQQIVSVNGIERSVSVKSENIPLHINQDSQFFLGKQTWHQRMILGEMIVVSAPVSLETRKKIEGYMAHKWSFNKDLQDSTGNHLYVDNRPRLNL